MLLYSNIKSHSLHLSTLVLLVPLLQSRTCSSEVNPLCTKVKLLYKCLARHLCSVPSYNKFMESTKPFCLLEMKAQALRLYILISNVKNSNHSQFVLFSTSTIDQATGTYAVICINTNFIVICSRRFLSWSVVDTSSLWYAASVSSLWSIAYASL